MWIFHKRQDLLHESQKSLIFKTKGQQNSEFSLERKKQLDDTIVDCIIEDSRAFGDFRKTGIRRVIDLMVPGSNQPGRHHVMRNLKIKYTERYSSLQKLLSFPEAISLTCDLWQNRNACHFLTITAHFFDPNYDYVSVVVSFRRFKGQHLSSKIKCFIIKELEKLNIDTKVVSITTDSGSGIKKETSRDDFGFRVGCLAHKLNIVVKKVFNFWQPNSLREVSEENAEIREYSCGGDEEYLSTSEAEYEV